jgi:hypothetical protein
MAQFMNSRDPNADGCLVVETLGQFINKGYLKGQASWAKIGHNDAVGEAPGRISKDLRYVVANGITLCSTCHDATHGYQRGRHNVS